MNQNITPPVIDTIVGQIRLVNIGVVTGLGEGKLRILGLHPARVEGLVNGYREIPTQVPKSGFINKTPTPCKYCTWVRKGITRRGKGTGLQSLYSLKKILII